MVEIDPRLRAAVRHMAHVEAKRRAVVVAKFGLVIALSVAIAILLFGHAMLR